MIKIDNDNLAQMDIAVLSSDCDCFNKARPSFYFSLNQELGALHAKEKGCDVKTLYDNEAKTWMILRSRLTLDKMATWADELEVRTWCQSGYKLYCPRVVEAYEKKSGERVFSSMSWWILMDLAKHRPCRPNTLDDRLPPMDKDKHYQDPALPQFPSAEGLKEASFQKWDVEINYYDTDYNKHVNNISYINWSLDAYPKDFLDTFRPTLIDAKWEKQSYLTDSLTVKTYIVSDADGSKPSFLSRISREDECVFEAYIEWERK